MKKLLIAFDIDGTLRCNCNETCQDTNQRVVDLLNILRHMKNVTICIWSGGGKDYAVQWGEKFDIPHFRCFSKLQAPKMDLAIDDQQEFDLATVNIIVREK